MFKTNARVSKKYTTSFYRYLLIDLKFSRLIFVTFEAFEMYLCPEKWLNKPHAHGQNTPAVFFISVFRVVH